jgi:hypothetical protein
MTTSPTISLGSSFIKTIWNQLNNLFVNRLTGHLDLLAHWTRVRNSSPLHRALEQDFEWPDGLVSERIPVDPHTLSLQTRPTRHGQSVFEVKTIKLLKEELKLCVPATYFFAFFLFAATSLQVTSAGEGVTMNGSDDGMEPERERNNTLPNFDFNVGGTDAPPEAFSWP